MKPNHRLIALGAVAFLIFLVTSAPASIITELVSSNAPVAFTNVSGTIWHGQARQIAARNIVIGPVSWSVQPWYLLRGEFASKIVIQNSGSSDDVTGSLWLSLGLPGVLKIRDADLNAAAEWAFAAASIPITASGRVLVHIDQLRARSESLPEVKAAVTWQNAGVTYPQKYALGAYKILLQHEPEENPERVVAEISDEHSSLHIKGKAWVEVSGQYQLDINISADNNAPQDIARVLPMLGAKQADGSVQFKSSGKLSDYL